MKDWFYRTLVQLRIKKAERYVMYRNTGTDKPYWISLGSVLAPTQTDAKNLIAKAEGFSSFEELCRVSGITPETHRIERIV